MLEGKAFFFLLITIMSLVHERKFSSELYDRFSMTLRDVNVTQWDKSLEEGFPFRRHVENH